jgi:putative cardiolipin synthase
MHEQPRAIPRVAARRQPWSGLAARFALLCVVPWLTHCATAPSLQGVEPSYALPPARSAALDAAVMSEPGDAGSAQSGVRLVDQNALAFAYRAASAAAATRSIDVQYYIWHDDLTGRLLAAGLMRAAERGVRVRVLVDDIDARAKHELFQVADQHHNVEVRIFNPFYSRSGTFGLATEWLTRAERLNRRMHNKAWIVDNSVAIVGGRNIGDEYFGASEHSNFSDLDVVLTGPVVADVSKGFDDYWNSAQAVPVSRFDHDEPEPGALARLLEGAQDYQQQAGDTPYVAALRDETRRSGLLALQSPPVPVDDVQVLVDDPAKVGSDSSGLDASNVLSGLAEVMSAASGELLIVSPYFVPRREGTKVLVKGVQRGVRTAVLTNSLAATDVAAVHTGYARQRRELLRGGVELFEMKRKAGSEEGRKQISVTGSSGASLHTKAMIIDKRWVYVGSMNLDPRSAFLNTEMGVLVDSPELAAQVRVQFERTTGPELSYRVVLEDNEGLVWYDRVRGRDRRLEREPDASVGRRVSVTLMRVLPIDSLL